MKQSRMMNRQTDIPEEMYNDEVVCFLADRYHTTPRKVIQCFIEQNNRDPGMVTEACAFRLEKNEVAILQDMLAGYHS